MIYETIYKKLGKLLPELQDGRLENRKLKAAGFMDLNVDVLYREEEDRIVIALSHYYRHDCGDMIADPDMEIAVMPKRQMAEALAYQDAFGNRRVYPEPGKVDIRDESFFEKGQRLPLHLSVFGQEPSQFGFLEELDPDLAVGRHDFHVVVEAAHQRISPEGNRRKHQARDDADGFHGLKPEYPSGVSPASCNQRG